MRRVDKRLDYIHAYQEAAREATLANDPIACISFMRKADELKSHIIIYPTRPGVSDYGPKRDTTN